MATYKEVIGTAITNIAGVQQLLTVMFGTTAQLQFLNLILF
jgi:hypothetical protein